jgi:hypothetical protein
LPTEAPQILAGNNPKEDTVVMLEKGYGLLGYSSFNGANVDQNLVLDQAEKVNAEVVLYYKNYTHTISGSYSLVLPDNKTTTTYTSGNVYGGGDVASYSGTSTSTTYGTTTTEVPYSVARYDYFASYWIKLKPKPFGAYLIDIPSDLAEEIGTNKGALIKAVIKGSPAFMADVLRGDVVKSINGIEVIDSKTALDLIRQNVGKKISVNLLRKGKAVKKHFQLGMPSS